MKRRIRRRNGLKTTLYKVLRFELLDERCVMDAGIAGLPSQFGSVEAFDDFFIDQAVDRYQSWFGKPLGGWYNETMAVPLMAST
jgi:hypothetical protein